MTPAASLACGFGLLAETAVACCLVFALPISTYRLVGPLVASGTCGALIAGTEVYKWRARP